MPESIIKALERYLTPQINEIKGELKAINTRIDELDKRMNVRFDAVNERFNPSRDWAEWWFIPSRHTLN